MESHPDVPDSYNCLQRTIMYCILLGGDTDTIATMAGAMAGAFYGEEQVPQSWKESCEAYEEAEKLADGLCELYHQPAWAVNEDLASGNRVCIFASCS